MTDPTKVERLWVALAPAGVPSPGPAVCPSEDIADEYRRMGWEVRGPYLPVQEVERLEAERDHAKRGWQNEEARAARYASEIGDLVRQRDRLGQALRELEEAAAQFFIRAKMEPGKPENTKAAVRIDAALSQAREILGGSE